MNVGVCGDGSSRKLLSNCSSYSGHASGGVDVKRYDDTWILPQGQSPTPQKHSVVEGQHPPSKAQSNKKGQLPFPKQQSVEKDQLPPPQEHSIESEQVPTHSQNRASFTSSASYKNIGAEMGNKGTKMDNNSKNEDNAKHLDSNDETGGNTNATDSDASPGSNAVDTAANDGENKLDSKVEEGRVDGWPSEDEGSDDGHSIILSEARSALQEHVQGLLSEDHSVVGELTPREAELHSIRKSVHQRISQASQVLPPVDNTGTNSHQRLIQSGDDQLLLELDSRQIWQPPMYNGNVYEDTQRNSYRSKMTKHPTNPHNQVNGWTDSMEQQLSHKLNTLDHAATKRGKLVTFFKNGDPHFKGLKTSVGIKQFQTFDTLLAWLSEKIVTPIGVRYIFLLPEKTEITDIGQFLNGGSYLVSSTKRIIRETYGDSREQYWSNRPPTAGRFRKGETIKLLEYGRVRKTRSFPTSRTGSLKNYNYQDHTKSEATIASLGLAIDTNTRPKVLTIISNTYRDSSEKFILNPKTTQTYEEVLSDISDMLSLKYPPVSSLWTSRKPYVKVKGFSHMLRALKHHSTFLAVGQELEPFEVSRNPGEDGDLQNADYEEELLPPPPPKQKPQKQPQPVIHHRNQHKPALIEPYPDYDPQTEPPLLDRITPPPTTQAYEYRPHRQQWRDERRTEDPGGQKQYADPPPPPPRVDESTQLPEFNGDSSRHQEEREPTPVTPHPPPRLKPQPVKQLPRESGDESPVMREVESVDMIPQSRKNMPYYKPYEERESVSVNIHGFPRTFYAPRYGQHEPDGSKPKKKLRLDWVYGYRGRDARNNLLLLSTDELVYFVSAVAVVYDIKRNQQRHYMEHNEDITCIALHPDRAKPKVATGQMAGHSVDEAAHVRVWDPITLVTYAVVGMDFFTKSVSSVGFSTRTGSMEPGALLMAVDEGEKHMMSIWNWQMDRMVAKTTTSTDTIVWGQFHPQDHTTLVTFGKNHVFFWKLFWDPDSQSEGKILRDKKSGLFEGDYLPKFVTSMAFSSSGDVITGDSNGRVVVWQCNHEDAYVYNQTLSLPMKNAHQKSVFVLCMLEDGTLISGGGHDLKCWDSLNGYRFLRENEVSTDYGFVRTVVPVQSSHAYNHLYIGTTENCILEGTLRDHFTPIVQAHCGESSFALGSSRLDVVTSGEDSKIFKRSLQDHKLIWSADAEGPYEECWSLATHPDDYTFVTAGVDQQVRKWDALNRSLIWQTRVEKPCLSIDLDPTGIVIALGTTVGRFIVLSNLDGMHIFSQQVGKAQLGVIKFSPEGDFIAIGSHDSSIYIYEVEDEGRVFRRHGAGVLRGHKNFVTHIDWARNGKYLRSVSGDYDLLFWSVHEMREVSAKSMRDEVWYTETCVLSYNHLGAWSNLTEGGDINTMDLAHRKDILAVGENMGSLRLYRFPCTAERPHYNDQKKYSGHVTKVAFTFDDNFLITCGGRDAGILQWAIIKTGQL